MAHRLVIILANIDPSDSVTLGAPFAQATAAAAMEYDVEIILSGRSEPLARKGFAAEVTLQDHHKSLYDLMRAVHHAGVKFKVCPPPDTTVGIDTLVPEIDEIVGGAYLISEVMDDDTATLTY